MAEKKIRIKQTRSVIGHTKRQRKTLQALGLGRIGRSVEHKEEPSILGMVRAVSHLVDVERVADAGK